MQMVRLGFFERKDWCAKALVLEAMRVFGEQAKTWRHNFWQVQDLRIAVSLWKEKNVLLAGLLEGWERYSCARALPPNCPFD
jgi:hypothetical protein